MRARTAAYPEGARARMRGVFRVSERVQLAHTPRCACRRSRFHERRNRTCMSTGTARGRDLRHQARLPTAAFRPDMWFCLWRHSDQGANGPFWQVRRRLEFEADGARRSRAAAVPRTKSHKLRAKHSSSSYNRRCIAEKATGRHYHVARAHWWAQMLNARTLKLLFDTCEVPSQGCFT